MSALKTKGMLDLLLLSSCDSLWPWRHLSLPFRLSTNMVISGALESPLSQFSLKQSAELPSAGVQGQWEEAARCGEVEVLQLGYQRTIYKCLIQHFPSKLGFIVEIKYFLVYGEGFGSKLT